MTCFMENGFAGTIFSGGFHGRLAETLCRIGNETDPWVRDTVAIASHFLSEGHSCWDMRRPLSELLDVPVVAQRNGEEWRQRLERSSLCAKDDDASPLVLDSAGRLYLRRFFEWEQRLCRRILERADGRLQIISGGPGTGKTTSVAALLAQRLYEAMLEKKTPPSILVMAPTGKAASRLKESFRRAKVAGAIPGSSLPPEAVWMIPDEALTIHRALGVNAVDPSRIRHTADNPLMADIVVVDECSMVDLATMTRLVEAVAAQATLVLLGDRHQLVSVEAGSVFVDLCAAASRGGSLAGCYRELTENHRFSRGGGIGLLAQLIQTGAADEAVALLKSGACADIDWVSTDDNDARRKQIVEQAVSESRWFDIADDQDALANMATFRIVSALREGPTGVETLNRCVEDKLVSERRIPPGHRNYSGRPVMVTSNDYAAQLFNGDTGMVRSAPHGGFNVLFEGQGGSVRSISPGRMPSHETVYAMTIHKTQGSEMEHVAVVLPPVKTPISTRELLYTAVTRARTHLTLYATESAVRDCVNASVRRMSGLEDALGIARP